MSRFGKLGCGKTFIRAVPFVSTRFAGITLPGNTARVVGSVMGISLPFRSMDWEKSPARSSAVGTVTLPEPPLLIGQYSCDQKKNSLSRFLLNEIGRASCRERV